MTATFNLTEKRIEVLRWLARQANPVIASYLAEECLPRQGRGYSRQQATRTGAGYARRLAEAGLVCCTWETYGWGLVCITSEGRRVLAAVDRDDGTLFDCLERARSVARSKRYYWWGTNA